MPLFLALCLVSRLAYAFNDVLVGRLARENSRLEMAALRGVALGLTMAPLVAFVPRAVWPALAASWRLYLLMITLTGLANVLQNQAARFLPFGVRAALMISAVSVVSVWLGAVALGERLSAAQAAFCLVLVGSAVRAGVPPGLPRRFARVAAASAPTVIGSGASIAALTLRPLGVWGALGGSQVLLTA